MPIIVANMHWKIYIYFIMTYSPHFQLFYFNERLELFEWKIKNIYFLFKDYFHSHLCLYLPRVPILVEGTVNTCSLAICMYTVYSDTNNIKIVCLPLIVYMCHFHVLSRCHYSDASSQWCVAQQLFPEDRRYMPHMWPPAFPNKPWAVEK